MADFIFLPDAKEIINLDQIAAAYMEPEVVPSEEYELEVVFVGDDGPVSYGHDDSAVLLEALAGKLGLQADDLAVQMRRDPDEFDDDPLGADS